MGIYFYLSRCYHTKTAAGESRWADSIDNDALCFGPFCEELVLLAGPPGGFHVDSRFRELRGKWLVSREAKDKRWMSVRGRIESKQRPPI